MQLHESTNLRTRSTEPPMELYSRGRSLGSSKFSELVPAPGPDASHEGLQQQLAEQGYLFVRGLFDRQSVMEVRRDICQMLYEDGALEPGTDPMGAIAAKSLETGPDEKKGSSTYDRIGAQCGSMHSLLYSTHTMSFFSKLLGGNVMHYALTWFRAVAPGLGTVPHCDVVYMGRGTHNLFTCWVPYGDISYDLGGLMILENSMAESAQWELADYLCRDVDEYCSNKPLPAHVDLESVTDNKVWDGWLADEPTAPQKRLGGRWLTAEYRAGDVLIFPCKAVHASLDNQSDRFRLSSDSRYQLASEPADERFIGEGPYGHVGRAKRGRVC